MVIKPSDSLVGWQLGIALCSPPIIWMGKNHCRRVEMGGGRVQKYRSKKRSSKTMDIVSYALEVSVNCSPFQVFTHIFKFVNWLKS